MLKDIETFIRERRRVCLADITARFGIDAAALLPMLELLKKRGRLRRIPASGRDCGGCGQCDPARLSMWAWAGDPAPSANDGASPRQRP